MKNKLTVHAKKHRITDFIKETKWVLTIDKLHTHACNIKNENFSDLTRLNVQPSFQHLLYIHIYNIHLLVTVFSCKKKLLKHSSYADGVTWKLVIGSTTITKRSKTQKWTALNNDNSWVILMILKRAASFLLRHINHNTKETYKLKQVMHFLDIWSRFKLNCGRVWCETRSSR